MDCDGLVLSLLPSQPMDFLTLPIQFGLVRVDLPLLTLVLDLLTLHLIADQSARTQAQPAPD